jgi:NAD kinase
MTLAPRVVVVHRRTELEELVDRHSTRGQAEFFLRTRHRNLAEVQARHDAAAAALHTVSASIPAEWRRGAVERADLERFLFDPEDVIVVVGQDGLVANVAKYLHGQPVIGVDPEPGRNPAVLVTVTPDAFRAVLLAVIDHRAQSLKRTMVAADTDDGQHLVALNEIYLGQPGHQSTRYRLITPDGREEPQSSSGLLVGTGTGATGWLRSTWRERHSDLRLPDPGDRQLGWFVREAWPSPVTGTDLTQGVLGDGQTLQILVENDMLVLFGDGLETDRLTPVWGQIVRLHVATRCLNHITGHA